MARGVVVAAIGLVAACALRELLAHSCGNGGDIGGDLVVIFATHGMLRRARMRASGAASSGRGPRGGGLGGGAAQHHAHATFPDHQAWCADNMFVWPFSPLLVSDLEYGM
jgi:hypothetical protein